MNHIIFLIQNLFSVFVFIVPRSWAVAVNDGVERKMCIADQTIIYSMNFWAEEVLAFIERVETPAQSTNLNLPFIYIHFPQIISSQPYSQTPSHKSLHLT